MSRIEKKVDPEKVFRAVLKQEGIPQPEAEFQFAKRIGRKWRFDYAWPRAYVALEVEGGVWTGGRHTSGSGFMKDIEKYNFAAYDGWLVLRTVPSTLCSRETLDLVRGTLYLRMEGAA